MEKEKMFLFARWVSVCYADSHLDDKMKCENDEGFNVRNSISVLNREDGYWWKEQLEHFEREVYPNYEKNGIVKDTKEFLESTGQRG